MKVTYELTPNPASMKFNFANKIAEGTHDFPNVESTDKSPLAAKIFGFPWTAGVYLGEDFVTITKQDWVDWEILATPLAGLLAEHVESGQPVLINIQSSLDESENDPEIVKKIKRVIQNEIKPVVALDGGDIVFGKFEEGVLYIHMRGSCSGCPSSQATLKDGIEVRMKELFTEILEVRAL
jgi:Fe-S cluster biogenesis protein NfuA